MGGREGRRGAGREVSVWEILSIISYPWVTTVGREGEREGECSERQGKTKWIGIGRESERERRRERERRQ